MYSCMINALEAKEFTYVPIEAHSAMAGLGQVIVFHLSGLIDTKTDMQVQ